jgi:hypothetical protein
MTTATRTRINVYAYPDDESHEPPVLAGHFIRESALYWTAEWEGVNPPDRGTGIYRTAQGRWVFERWTNWQGEKNTYEYISAEQAHDWLLANHHDDAVAECFGPVEDERGPGRPEVGPAINVRLGEMLEGVDAYASRNGITSRAAAIRHAIQRGINCELNH